MMVFVDRGTLNAPIPRVDPGFMTPDSFRASAATSTSFRPWGRTDSGGLQESWGGWGAVSRREFTRDSSSVTVSAPTGPVLFASVAIPRGPLGSPADSLSTADPTPGRFGGPTVSMFMGGEGQYDASFGGDMTEHKDNAPPPPPPARGRDFPRAPFLPGSMMGLQFAQDQALRGLAANPDAVTPASNPVATTESITRAGSPPLQPSPEFSRQGSLSPSLVIDDQAMAQAFSIDYTLSPGRARANPEAVANDPAAEESPETAPEVAADDEPEQALLPRAAGLIATLLPHDQRSLEEAVDQFLDQLHDLNVGSLIEPSPIRALVVSATLLGVGVAIETTRRRLNPRRRRNQPARLWDASDSEDLLGFPELPGSWSARWI